MSYDCCYLSPWTLSFDYKIKWSTLLLRLLNLHLMIYLSIFLKSFFVLIIFNIHYNQELIWLKKVDFENKRRWHFMSKALVTSNKQPLTSFDLYADSAPFFGAVVHLLEPVDEILMLTIPFDIW